MFHGNHNCSPFSVSALEVLKIELKFALFSMKLVCSGELEEKGRITGLAFIIEEVAKLKIKQGIGN